MNEQKYPDRICYHYEKDKEAILRPSHGVWGGVNPHGEIELCFYDESDMPPETVEQLIGADGAPGPERRLNNDNSRHIARHIHTRLLLNYGTARAVMEWLEERIGELEAEGQSEIYDINSGIQQ